jgi:uncharacterized protein (DUF1778 family)
MIDSVRISTVQSSLGRKIVPVQFAKKRSQSTPKPKTFRFDARLNEQQKLLIQRAAELEGRSMTDFVLHSAEIAAAKAIERRATLVLTAHETAVFVNAVLKPAKPGVVLRRAARDYRQKTTPR